MQLHYIGLNISFPDFQRNFPYPKLKLVAWPLNALPQIILLSLHCSVTLAYILVSLVSINKLWEMGEKKLGDKGLRFKEWKQQLLVLCMSLPDLHTIDICIIEKFQFLITKEFNMNMLQELSVMINFMCQLGWAMLSRQVAQHYSGRFCEDVFFWEINI